MWDWAERLATNSDPGYAERGELTVTYLTDAHRAVAQRLAHWMKTDCGFDNVEIDAVGNVVGIYHGTHRNAKRLLTGSHYDTVRNGGKYDGRLGILVPMACVRELHRAGRRLPFGFEVVGFAEEEGQRYKATFLGSGALTGHFDMTWLDQADNDGVTMRQAMTHAGLCIDDIPKLKRDPAKYLGFVEVHIEQGPGAERTRPAAGHRHVDQRQRALRRRNHRHGQPRRHHADGPPARRRSRRGRAGAVRRKARRRRYPTWSPPSACSRCPTGRSTWCPADARSASTSAPPPTPCATRARKDVLAELATICERRGVHHKIEETMRAAAAPSAAPWQARWEAAVQSLGLPIFRMPSGAGHDAMKLHEAMPQAMLFQRGQNAGISHNPLESITNHDTELCVQAFATLLDNLAAEQTSQTRTS